MSENQTSTESSAARALPLSVAVGWGVGSAALGVAAFVRVLALAFLVDYVGIAPSLAGSLIALATIYDAILDPFVGLVSDRTRSRWGRRMPYMVAGSIGLCGAWLGVFHIPNSLGHGGLVTYVVVGLLIYSTAYALFSVPYNAVPAEITSNYHDRSFLMALRTAFFVIGTTGGGVLAPMLITHFGGGRPGHEWMSTVMGGVTLAVGCLCVFLIRRAPFVHRDEAQRRIRPPVFSIFRNRHFVLLLICFVLVTLGSAMSNVAGLLYARRVLGQGDAWFARFFLFLNIFMLGSLPLWLIVAKRLGKRLTYIVGAVMVSGSAFSWYWAIPGEDVLVLAVRTFFIGAGSSALLTMLNSMLPDTMEFDQRSTGLYRAGVYSGFFTTAEKGMTALGVALTGAVLSMSGYVESSRGDAIHQSPTALHGIFVCFAIVPAVSVGLSALLMHFYALSEAVLLATNPSPASAEKAVDAPNERRLTNIQI